MTAPRRELGLEGERLAERFLRRGGLKLLARRYATPVGEIDLIMRDGETVVFVEVKTRRTRAWADPEDAVGPEKQRRMQRCASWYLRARRKESAPFRFDIVAVTLPEVGEPQIEHFESAFEPGR